MRLRLPSGLTPRSFYGRAVLILIVPIIVIQIVLSVVFIQRHYERVTEQMTRNTLSVVIQALDQRDTQPLLDALDIRLTPAQAPARTGAEPRNWLDLAGREVVAVLREALPGYLSADLMAEPGVVLVWVEGREGILELAIPRRLVSAANPHQLLVIVFLASILMAGIAFQFLRLQIRPIRRLGQAAEAYGRGENMPLKSAGAREIRAASLAFIDMRNRLERTNAQRKIMLSGVSHDMRTPLTRMRLILSMMEDDDDTRALRVEIGDLERLLDSFLDYSRGQSTPVLAPVDLGRVVRDLVARYRAQAQDIRLDVPNDLPVLRLDQRLIERALDNLLSNACRYGTMLRVTLRANAAGFAISVEDNGPGIPPRERAQAVEPFVRLDAARNQDKGGGLGLGLAIVTEIASAHGGTLVLEQSAELGGLKATLRLPIGAQV
jgi:two-component system osmolarity sensor histidine kinase EnvZ